MLWNKKRKAVSLLETIELKKLKSIKLEKVQNCFFQHRIKSQISKSVERDLQKTFDSDSDNWFQCLWVVCVDKQRYVFKFISCDAQQVKHLMLFFNNRIKFPYDVIMPFIQVCAIWQQTIQNGIAVFKHPINDILNAGLK